MILIEESKCNNCNKCIVACPAKGLKGRLWNKNSKREELLDPFKCRKKARELLRQRTGIDKALCGKCIEVCPFTRRYTNKNNKL